MKPALLLFAHGARDAQWAAPFRRIHNDLVKRCPGLTVELAFLELMSPNLEEALNGLSASGHERIVIAPLFMAQGGHLKQDLPRLLDQLRERNPRLSLELLPPIGEVDSILDAITDWLIGAVRAASP
jgi:sirohydrochlorin cobaltochelatase